MGQPIGCRLGSLKYAHEIRNRSNQIGKCAPPTVDLAEVAEYGGLAAKIVPS